MDKKVLDKIAKEAGFAQVPSKLKVGTCVKCGEDATEFKDKVSSQEYRITGFCQKCQDDYYYGMEE